MEASKFLPKTHCANQQYGRHLSTLESLYSSSKDHPKRTQELPPDYFKNRLFSFNFHNAEANSQIKNQNNILNTKLQSISSGNYKSKVPKHKDRSVPKLQAPQYRSVKNLTSPHHRTENERIQKENSRLDQRLKSIKSNFTGREYPSQEFQKPVNEYDLDLSTDNMNSMVRFFWGFWQVFQNRFWVRICQGFWGFGKLGG
jgi:hypothetical protein